MNINVCIRFTLLALGALVSGCAADPSVGQESESTGKDTSELTASDAVADDQAKEVSTEDGTAAEPSAVAAILGRMWHNQNYTGTRIVLEGNDPHLGDNSDEAHSVINDSPHYMVLFNDRDYGGACVAVIPRGHVADLNPISFGDRVTSVKFFTNRPARCTPVGSR